MISINKEQERAFIRECLKVYKSLPALWDATSKEYRNRQLKEESYSVLISKFSERYPGVQREDVKKKINTLRTNYRKELQRLQINPRNSRLWYFDEINFLRDQEHFKDVSNTNEEPQPTTEVFSLVKVDNNQPETILLPDDKLDDSNGSSYDEQTVIVDFLKDEEETVRPFAKKMRLKERPQRSFKTAYQQEQATSHQCCKQYDTEYDKVAQTWALELSKMRSDQQIHAKRAINAILYEGQLGNLYRDCVEIYPPLEH